MRNDVKNFVTRHWKLITFFFLSGITLGMMMWNVQLENRTIELEKRLSDTQEQLLISNDQLKQIRMRNEAEFYMNEENEE